MAEATVFTIYAQLVGFETKIWRRFEFNGRRPLTDLIYATMIMFEMQAKEHFVLTQLNREHLESYMQKQGYAQEMIREYGEKSPQAIDFRYEFEQPPVGIASPNLSPGADTILKDPTQTTLLQTLTWGVQGQRFLLEYGDKWKVNLVIEEIAHADLPQSKLPRVVGGHGYGIVEGLDGSAGLQRLDQVLRVGRGQEYQRIMRWLDSDNFSLSNFSVRDVNYRLKKLHFAYVKIYELGEPLTQRFEDLMLRDYLGKGYRGY